VASLVALTRSVSSALGDCELTHLDRGPIDIHRARVQHSAYVDALHECGCHVVRLPDLDSQPDSVFVEDTAIVLDEIAIVTRPGAPSRLGEIASVAAELERHRPVVRIRAPATLDGGDVLRIGRVLYVGASSRSSSDGVSQLRAAAAPSGYSVVPVALAGCLHLKTAVTAVAPDLLLVNPSWVDCTAFGSMRRIEIAPDEPFAANALLIRQHVIYDSGFPRTSVLVRQAGINVLTVDVSELAKAEGGVTCSSIVFETENAV
jgi:dimethylargininase